ncbi:acyltransferase [Alloacidobacterium dinghuense]|uniref:Acyltransferase n=1 Tax=Alloacidobacterium dinghuense TaxID=2763107 RepID=A0A7G8BHT9_9BACT|nr:acyltransferase [Alloacidobacterium dinghuense]QNI32109.1 acyltransferase [Alloacidobacterium dinghuense]
MPRYEYRDLHPSREAEEVYLRWLKYLDEEFTKHRKPELRAELVHDNLHQLMLGQPKGGRLNFTLTSELPFNVLKLSLDSANITLEPEYYGDIDEKRYACIKPLIYFWQMFDRSPIGLNHWLGFRFRAMLGKHIFKHIGNNVKIFHGVEFSFGYNLVIEDDCVIHKFVMLDDRGELIIRKGTSISDYASVYSHAHDPIDGGIVENRRTEVGPKARVTIHASVMAGVNVGEDTIIGANGVATRDIAPHSIVGGVPAKQLKTKDQATPFKDRSTYKAPPSTGEHCE